MYFTSKCLHSNGIYQSFATHILQPDINVTSPAAYGAITTQRSRIKLLRSEGSPSFLRATLCIDVEVHFVRIVTSMRVCTDKRARTTQL